MNHPVEFPIDLYVGVDFGPLYIHAKDPDGDIFVLTGWTPQAHIRRWPTNTLLITLAPVVSNAAQGIITLQIDRNLFSSLDPDEYAVWDLLVVSTTDKRIGPIIGGVVSILDPVTQLV